MQRHFPGRAGKAAQSGNACFQARRTCLQEPPLSETHRVILLKRAQDQQANHDNGWFNGFNPRKEQQRHM